MIHFKSLTPNTIALFFAQLFGISGAIAITFMGGIVGTELANSKLLITLPIAALVIGGAIFAMPSALLMKRFGRKTCFILSSIVSSIALLICSYAINISNFYLFCLACALVGANGAFMQHYRFAVIEGLALKERPNALTMQLIACAIGVFLGISIFSIVKNYSANYIQDSFLIVSLIVFLSTLSILFYKQVEETQEQQQEQQKSVNTSSFWPLIILASGAYIVMSLVMVPTPIQMSSIHNHSIGHTSIVMQMHLLAMYIPSVTIGVLLKKMSAHTLLNVGIFLLVTGVLVSLLGSEFTIHLTGLILIGIGWCYVFVVATNLFASSYSPKDKFKSQAINDMTIFSTNAIASLSAGSIVISLGWNNLMYLSLFILILMILASIALTRSHKKFSAVKS